jgi:hypothetical protein
MKMRYAAKWMATLFLASFIGFSSCNEKATTREEVEITTMDSTSKVLKNNTSELEDQTKKVEASIEKLEAEFELNN